MRYRNLGQTILASLVLGVVVVACGSGGTGKSGATPAPTVSSGSAPAAAAQIKSNWEAFFSAKTPASQRVKLLQNGQEFASIIKSQAGSALASSVSAQVTKVTVISPAKANVKYNILVGGTPQLRNRAGISVKENGIWKVGVASFCGLLALQNGGSTSQLPPACQHLG